MSAHTTKKLTFPNFAFWLYFILQYILPVFLILPYLNPDVCGFDCPNKDTTGAIIVLFLVFSFSKLKSTFPKESAGIIKVFLPFVLSATAFIFLYGFSAFVKDARLYGFVSVSSTFFAITVWVLFNFIKDAFKKRRHIAKKIGELVLMLLGFSIYAIPMVKIGRVLLENIKNSGGMQPAIFILYIVGTFCIMTFSLFHYFWASED